MERWKLLMIFPALLLAISILVLINNYVKRGEIIEKDVELTGGMVISVPVRGELNLEKLEEGLEDVSVRLVGGSPPMLIIQSPERNATKILESLREFVDYDLEEVEIGDIEPVLGEVFWEQGKMALALAFTSIALVIFLLFRSPIPCFTVILCSISNFIITLAAMSIFGVYLSLATLGALLMMLGYSIDTNMLLTTAVLKRKGDIESNIKKVRKTGLTITLVGLLSLLPIYFLSNNPVVQEISFVLGVGIAAEAVNTWIQNAGILRWWVMRR